MHVSAIVSSVNHLSTIFKVYLVVIHCKKYYWKKCLKSYNRRLVYGAYPIRKSAGSFLQFPQKLPVQYRKLTAIIPSSSFPMHYSLITLLWEATESALLVAIFINRTHTHMYHKRCSRIDYFPLIVSLETIWAGLVAHMEKKNTYRVLVGKPERRSLF